MGKVIITFFAVIMIVLQSCTGDMENINYQGNPEPLKQNAYIKLPLGAIKPAGWLKSQLEAQAEALPVMLTISGLIWLILHGGVAMAKPGKEGLITSTDLFRLLIFSMMKS